MKFEFNVGDKVHVESLHGDLFDDFTGTIAEIDSDSFIVEDEDHEMWTVEKYQVTFAKYD